MGCCASSPFADFRGLREAPRFALRTAPLPGRVVRVVDGDTIDFVTDRVPAVRGLFCYRCRLAGIDAPELHPSRALPGRDAEVAAARRAAERLGAVLGAADNMAFAAFQGSDKYGRYLVRLSTPSGTDVNGLLVAEGLARPYDGGTKVPFAASP